MCLQWCCPVTVVECRALQKYKRGQEAIVRKSLCANEAPYASAGHPEFSRDFMDTLIEWRTATAPEALPQDQANAALAQLSDQPVTTKDEAALKCMCQAFLKAKA